MNLGHADQSLLPTIRELYRDKYRDLTVRLRPGENDAPSVHMREDFEDLLVIGRQKCLEYIQMFGAGIKTMVINYYDYDNHVDWQPAVSVQADDLNQLIRRVCDLTLEDLELEHCTRGMSLRGFG